MATPQDPRSTEQIVEALDENIRIFGVCGRLSLRGDPDDEGHIYDGVQKCDDLGKSVDNYCCQCLVRAARAHLSALTQGQAEGEP